MKRRSFVKWAAAFPLLAQVGLEQALGTGWAEVARNSTDNIYTRLGVKPLINGRGTWTYLSASLELPEVRAAQVEAAQHFVNIFDLQLAAGRRLAELTGAESGMIYTPEENQCPTLAISWDQKGWRYSTADCARQLLEGTPAIAVLTGDNPSDVLSRKPTTEKGSKKDDNLQIVSMTLRPGEEIIIGRRLRQLLTQARRLGTQS
jgi:hypothetical protein